ncbi:MAG: regulatory protein RecX [Gammaproteobacteria bacterium]|nr:regulatory protein RecX [Gammaproteobacteria bacterium]
MPSDETKARERALLLLARREHSCLELLTKLKRQGFVDEIATAVIDELAASGCQSEQRFTEQYIHSRQQRGYGPVRIEQELKIRGINDGLIGHYLANINWLALVANVRKCRFGNELPDDYSNQAKEMRFLQYRGFTQEQIYQLYKMRES